MSVFALPPFLETGDNIGLTWEDGIFTEDELTKIVEVGNKCSAVSATVHGEESLISKVRETDISWIELSEESHFIYLKLSDYISHINKKCFNFDIFGYIENLQYTVYTPGSHYAWHVDTLFGSSLPARKLSVVLMLSDVGEYEGGDLQLFTAQKPITLEPRKGRVYVFPSFVLHRVTPVTKGTRKTLVSWISGNKFK